MKKVFYGLVVLMIASSPLSAHERRPVAGEYEFVVGYLNEPAFSGQMNGLDLRVSKDGKPVEGLETTLQSVVRYGSETETLPLALKKRHKEPGSYAGYFLPGKPGKYTFEISGTIEGKPVKEIFESGEKFRDVADAESLRWPKA